MGSKVAMLVYLPRINDLGNIISLVITINGKKVVSVIDLPCPTSERSLKGLYTKGGFCVCQ